MLPQKHRLTRPGDFTAVMRTGSRAGTSTVVVAVLTRPVQHDDGHAGTDVDWRCGFIVSKAVGNAVVRHRTTRRLRHVVGHVLGSGAVSVPTPEHTRTEIVVRALGAAAEAGHAQLVADVESGLRRAVRKAESKRQVS